MPVPEQTQDLNSRYQTLGKLAYTNNPFHLSNDLIDAHVIGLHRINNVEAADLPAYTQYEYRSAPSVPER